MTDRQREGGNGVVAATAKNHEHSKREHPVRRYCTCLSPPGSTADDTLIAKQRDGHIIAGGRLVAKALKNEGMRTIFTLCGGHTIDIYDEFVDGGSHVRRAARTGRSHGGFPMMTETIKSKISPEETGCPL